MRVCVCVCVCVCYVQSMTHCIPFLVSEVENDKNDGQSNNDDNENQHDHYRYCNGGCIDLAALCCVSLCRLYNQVKQIQFM